MTPPLLPTRAESEALKLIGVFQKSTMNEAGEWVVVDHKLYRRANGQLTDRPATEPREAAA